MSNSDPAEVMQGRLGWEDGDVSAADPEELEPHPKNTEIYGDTRDISDINDEFVESIREKGVLEPLVVTNGKQIISGHRRWIAARAVALDSVPIRKSAFDDELSEREALIEFNRQREKTPGQIVNEFEEMLKIEKQRAKERQAEAGIDNLPTTDSVSSGKISQASDEERSRENTAKKINADVSGRTLEKGKKVKDKATSDDEPEKVREAAEDAWNDLQSGDESFHGAYEEVKQAEQEVEEREEREQKETERRQSFESTSSKVETFHGDFYDILSEYEKSIDHIITDPPYDKDAVELWRSLGEIAAETLPEGGFVIAYSGKAHLPAVHDVLSDNLNYYWQGIVRHQGPGAKIFSRKLRTGYKPVLIYQKGQLNAQESFVSDVIEGTGREKDDHDWQQAEGEAAELLDRFTAVDDTVCDPMCGSGTVGVACQRLQRRCVLIDNDTEAIETTRRKCEDVSDE
jgi:ParB-like chromosome segregation protein Spo0J